MNERTQDARSAAQTVATWEDSTAPATGSGAATVHALLARGQRDPNVIAAVVQDNPGTTAEIFTFLNQTLGNRFVQAVLSVLAPGMVGAATGAMRVIAQGLHVRSSPDKASDKTSSVRSAITKSSTRRAATATGWA